MPRKKFFLLIVQVASLLFIALALLSFYGNASISIPYLRPPDLGDVPLGGRSMPRLHSSVNSVNVLTLPSFSKRSSRVRT